MNKTTNARAAALEALMRCRRDGAWSGDVLDSILKRAELDRRDAALASRLCLGVLQNDRLCDFYIDSFCHTKLEPPVRDILRLGVYQLLFLDRVPARAAVSETVELCRARGYARASGLVNAVLRRVADAESLPEIPGEGTTAYLATRWSHPEWLCETLTNEKGYADYIRALQRAEIPFEAMEPEGCIALEGGLATALPGFEEGLFYVQDRAARLAVEIAAPKPGMRVLDACACPGGKSFAAAIRMENSGSILSCDIHEKKLRLLNSGAERLGIGIIETRPMDARVFDAALEKSFDLVIADVPCSGLGVIAKKPEIRTKKPEELQGLPAIQGAILDNLSRCVKPGGTLLYSTCTILKEENEAVVLRFLREHTDYRAEAFTCCGIESDSGMYTFWPQIDGTDGFFAARLTRTF